MMGQSPDPRADDVSRHRDRIPSPRAPRALAAAEEWHMTKSLSKRVGLLSRARPLLYPLVLLSQNNDTALNNQVHEHLKVPMRITIRRCVRRVTTCTAHTVRSPACDHGPTGLRMVQQWSSSRARAYLEGSRAQTRSRHLPKRPSGDGKDEFG